jgi:hypothetical protein
MKKQHMIKVSQDTYVKLCKLGKYKDTMDDIIKKLLDKPKKKNKPSKPRVRVI